MSTIDEQLQTPVNDPPRPKRWSGAEYDHLVDMGAFDHQRIELINGEIFEMSPMNDPHAFGIKLVDFALRRIFSAEKFTIQIQCPMTLGEDSRPEPDLAVVAGDVRQQAIHPSSALLVVEVSDATIEFDRTIKAELYARHGVSDYWILNLQARRLEVHRRPDPASGRYLDVRALSSEESIAPLAAADAVISVSQLLP